MSRDTCPICSGEIYTTYKIYNRHASVSDDCGYVADDGVEVNSETVNVCCENDHTLATMAEYLKKEKSDE